MADDDLFFPKATVRREPVAEADGRWDDEDEDDWDDGPPAALRWAVGLLAAGVLAVGGFVVGRVTAPEGDGRVAAAGAGTTTTTGDDDVPSTTQAPSTTTTTSAPPPGLKPDDRVQLDRIGPVEVGMTLAEATVAAGQPIEVDEDSSPGGSASGCVFATPASGVPAVSFMLLDGDVARIDVGTAGVTTLSGIGVGSTTDEVVAAYGAERIAVEPHPYREDGRYLRFLPARQPELSLIFETDGSTVTSYRAGDADAVGFPEGCA